MWTMTLQAWRECSKEHVEGATRLALGCERLLVGQPEVIEVIVLLPPASRDLLGRDQDREEARSPATSAWSRASFSIASGGPFDGSPGEDVVNGTTRVRDSLTTRRSRCRARYLIPEHRSTPSRPGAAPPASSLTTALRDSMDTHLSRLSASPRQPTRPASQPRGEQVGSLCTKPALSAGRLLGSTMPHLHVRPQRGRMILHAASSFNTLRQNVTTNSWTPPTVRPPPVPATSSPPGSPPGPPHK
jgi:hypothetical protein